MKRHPALAGLSRDHHRALHVALQLRRATPARLEEVRRELLAFWAEHGAGHFRAEEARMLPALAALGPEGRRLATTLAGEHADLRRQIASLAAGGRRVTVAALDRLGQDLAAHVRREEREAFPLLQARLPDAELAALQPRASAASERSSSAALPATASADESSPAA